MASKKSSKGGTLLADHKQFGKKLVPPMMQLGELRLTSWVDVGLPESMWTAVLHNHLGLAAGVQLGLAVTRAVDSVTKRSVAVISEFEGLTSGLLSAARERLSEEHRAQLDGALQPFLRLYPECPLAPLVTPLDKDTPSALAEVKTLVEQMLERTSRIATLAQASVLYFVMSQGRYRVYEGSALSRISDIEKYPETPESRHVAASIRAALNMYFEQSSRQPSGMTWPRYFWNRGFELEKCYFESEGTGD